MTIKTPIEFKKESPYECQCGRGNLDFKWRSLSVVPRIEKENCPKRSAETLLIPTFMLTRTFFARAPAFPRFLLLSRFYPLFLREQRTTVLRDKTVCHESGIMHMYSVWVCHYCPSFFFLRFLVLVFQRDTLFGHISTAHYIFSIEQRQTAYCCLPLLYLQPRIETY